MKSALDGLTRIPEEDVVALRKTRNGALPRPQALVRPALLIVDMVEAFVRDEYPTGWAATGEPCARAIAELLARARERSIPVIYTVTERADHVALVGEWRRGEAIQELAPFALEPTAHRVTSELTPLANEIVVPKAKPSAFYGTQVTGILHALDVHSVIVTGMTTSGCVRASVVDAFSLNFHPVVPVEGVADRSQLSHEVSLFDMGAKYADVVTIGSVCDAIAELPSRRTE